VMALRWSLGLMLSASMLASAAVPAADAASDNDPPSRRGELVPGQPMQDATFGVSAEALALRREVRMFQWHSKIGEGGATVWDRGWFDEPQRIDPAVSDDSHRNPARLPFPMKEWRAKAVELDGYPVDGSVWANLDDWQPLPVAVSALPPNLAASLHDDGGCLFSGADSAVPVVGDVRICWSILPAGRISGSVRLQDEIWVLGTSPVLRGEPGSNAEPWFGLGASRLLPWLLVAAMVLFGVTFWRQRKRSSKR